MVPMVVRGDSQRDERCPRSGGHRSIARATQCNWRAASESAPRFVRVLGQILEVLEESRALPSEEAVIG